MLPFTRAEFQRWDGLPAFGLTPCPVTRRLLVIPLLWSLVGGSAAVLVLLVMPATRSIAGARWQASYGAGRPGPSVPCARADR